LILILQLEFPLGARVNQNWTVKSLPQPITDGRATERRPVTLPARLTWKDQRGIARFAGVTVRNVSACGVYVECSSPVSIPLYRLVEFQLERDVRRAEVLPEALRHGPVLSAVYRVLLPSQSRAQGLALRLMVEPRRAVSVEQTRASA
jgi:hypothetical protein